MSKVHNPILLKISISSPLFANFVKTSVIISACSFMTCKKSLSISKWNEGVISFLLFVHFSPVLNKLLNFKKISINQKI